MAAGEAEEGLRSVASIHDITFSDRESPAMGEWPWYPPRLMDVALEPKYYLSISEKPPFVPFRVTFMVVPLIATPDLRQLLTAKERLVSGSVVEDWFHMGKAGDP